MAPSPQPRTVSECLFGEYLNSNGHRDWTFEPQIPGKTKKPDFLVPWNGRDFRFEVKQREGSSRALRVGYAQVGYSDPIKGIRKTIDKARDKLREFKGHCCSVVIANAGDWRTDLTPWNVFGAMLGDLGFTMVLENGVAQPDSARSVFLPGKGKMIHPGTGELQNRTIAAVIVLENVRLRNAEFERLLRQATHEQQCELGRQLSTNQQAVLRCRVGEEYVKDGRGAIYKRLPRVIVCENPGARTPFPRDVLCGAFDERWAIDSGTLEQVS